jgi:hypothetical protein
VRLCGFPVVTDLDVDHQEALTLWTLNQALLLVDKGLERLDAVDNTLELHPAVAPAKGLTKQPHLRPKSAAGCSSLSWPARRAVFPGSGTAPHARCLLEAARAGRLKRRAAGRRLQRIRAVSPSTACRTQSLQTARSSLAVPGPRPMPGRLFPADYTEEPKIKSRPGKATN